MKTIILDMYGVIMKDPEGGFIPFVNRIFPHLSREDIYQHWNKADVGEISSLDLFKALGFEGNLCEIEKAYLDTIEIDDAFYTFAQTAKKQYRLALLSNDSSEWSHYLRNKYNLNSYFDVITVSGDAKIKKPDKQIFLFTLDKLKSAAFDCVYVDDRRFNLVAAQTLGMDTILFNSRHIPYDGKTVYSFQELTRLLISS